MTARQPFVKTRAGAPPDFFAVEAAGLRWLADAAERGGVPAPVPVAVHADRIVLPHVRETTSSTAHAEDLGRRLAATHRTGAAHHGCPPAGWAGDGYIATLRLPHATAPVDGGWGTFYARLRLAPYLGSLPEHDAARVHRLCDRLVEGGGDVAGPSEPAARLHGDLWSGNVLWSAAGAVVVDPAAHGGHRETDLAMLALFGLPHLDRVLAAYDEAFPLADGWRERVGLHQLHPLLVHAELFGGEYGRRAVEVASRYL
jgi:fructosamine-3-kinase